MLDERACISDLSLGNGCDRFGFELRGAGNADVLALGPKRYFKRLDIVRKSIVKVIRKPDFTAENRYFVEQIRQIIRKKKRGFLARDLRPDRMLGITPVDRLKHERQLRRRDRNDAIAGRWPDKPAAFETVGIKRHPDPIMPQNLQKIAAPASEDKQITAVRIALESLLDLNRERA